MSSAHSEIGRIFYSVLSFCRTYPHSILHSSHWKRPHADLIKGEVWLISGRAVTFISRLSFSLSAGASGLHTHTHHAESHSSVLSTLARRALRMTWGAPPIKTLLLSAAPRAEYTRCLYVPTGTTSSGTFERPTRISQQHQRWSRQTISPPWL